MPQMTTSVAAATRTAMSRSSTPGNSGWVSFPMPLSDDTTKVWLPSLPMPQALRLDVPQSTATHSVVVTPHSVDCGATLEQRADKWECDLRESLRKSNAERSSC